MPRAWFAVAAVAVCAMACGGGAAPTHAPSPTSPASPSPTPTQAGLVFKLQPEPGVTATGTATVTTTSKTVTVELKIAGLCASSAHVSHIHLGSCQSRGGIAFALNTVVVDGQGDADTKSTLQLTYPPSSGTLYGVVHDGPDMVCAKATFQFASDICSTA